MEKITAQTGPLAFIGGGAMTEAIIKGILGAGLADPGEIFVGEPSAARCEYLQKTYGIKASGDNKAVVKDAGLIILAVKPQAVDAAITAELAAAMPPQATVLSIMGSVDLAKLHQVVPGHAVIRVMPNTPLAVGAGMTAIAPDSKVSSEMIDAAKTIFGSCGEVEHLHAHAASLRCWGVACDNAVRDGVSFESLFPPQGSGAGLSGLHCSASIQLAAYGPV